MTFATVKCRMVGYPRLRIIYFSQILNLKWGTKLELVSIFLQIQNRGVPPGHD
jgi:hypothetical protein